MPNKKPNVLNELFSSRPIFSRVPASSTAGARRRELPTTRRQCSNKQTPDFQAFGKVSGAAVESPDCPAAWKHCFQPYHVCSNSSFKTHAAVERFSKCLKFATSEVPTSSSRDKVPPLEIVVRSYRATVPCNAMTLVTFTDSVVDIHL